MPRESAANAEATGSSKSEVKEGKFKSADSSESRNGKEPLSPSKNEGDDSQSQDHDESKDNRSQNGDGLNHP